MMLSRHWSGGGCYSTPVWSVGGRYSVTVWPVWCSHTTVYLWEDVTPSLSGLGGYVPAVTIWSEEGRYPITVLSVGGRYPVTV